mmetsp:Transcript_5132/g.7606  ORF Transcript_5132/g.7606 Transcript_5132/m.7606 type:complete len:171 (+) Transcript_5132:40-552(+)
MKSDRKRIRATLINYLILNQKELAKTTLDEMEEEERDVFIKYIIINKKNIPGLEMEPQMIYFLYRQSKRKEEYDTSLLKFEMILGIIGECHLIQTKSDQKQVRNLQTIYQNLLPETNRIRLTATGIITHELKESSGHNQKKKKRDTNKRNSSFHKKNICRSTRYSRRINK